MIGVGLPLSLSSCLHPRGPVRRSTVRRDGVLSIVLDIENVCNAGIFGDDGKSPASHFSGGYVRGDVHTNSMESVWAVLKRTIHGTWRHVLAKHLHRYVDEAMFRLNEGNVENHTLDRLESFASNAFKHRITYRKLAS